jgi:glutamine synthetase
VSESVFTDGLYFDGSSVRGFQGIQESDMLLIPDVSTVQEDRFRDRKTLMVYCHVHDAITGEAYSRDPRNIVRKAAAYLASTGIADTVYMGPEAEFFIFDSVNYQVEQRVVLQDRLDRGPLEHRVRRRARQPRVQAAHQAGLLPDPADGPLHRPALGDGARTSRRSASPQVHHHEVGAGVRRRSVSSFDTTRERSPTSS